MSTKTQKPIVKVIITGDAGCGKTSLLVTYLSGTFPTGAEQLQQQDFSNKVEVEVRGVPIVLDLWDTCGIERFRTANTSFYRRAVSGIVVFRVNDRESMEHVEQWIHEIRRYTGGEEPTPVVVVGHVFGSESGRVIGQEEARAKAMEHGANEYFEANASTGENVRDVIMRSAELGFDQTTSSSTDVARRKAAQEAKQPRKAGAPDCLVQ